MTIRVPLRKGSAVEAAHHDSALSARSERKRVTLAEAASQRRNNLDLIRTLAAASVIYLHAFPLSTGR